MPLRKAVAGQSAQALVFTFCKGALWGWTPDDFEVTVEAPLVDADPFDDEVMDFVHALLAPAQEVPVDGHGRVRIPLPLRELAGLEREVVINCVLNRIEVWDRARWDERFKASMERVRHRSGMPRRAP